MTWLLLMTMGVVFQWIVVFNIRYSLRCLRSRSPQCFTTRVLASSLSSHCTSVLLSSPLLISYNFLWVLFRIFSATFCLDDTSHLFNLYRSRVICFFCWRNRLLKLPQTYLISPVIHKSNFAACTFSLLSWTLLTSFCWECAILSNDGPQARYCRPLQTIVSS